MAKKRDVAREYRNYGGKQENIDKTARRVQARRDFIKAHGAAAAKGKDIHHVKPMSKGGGDSLSNLKAVGVTKNRKFKRDKNRKPMS